MLFNSKLLVAMRTGRPPIKAAGGVNNPAPHPHATRSSDWQNGRRVSRLVPIALSLGGCDPALSETRGYNPVDRGAAYLYGYQLLAADVHNGRLLVESLSDRRLHLVESSDNPVASIGPLGTVPVVRIVPLGWGRHEADQLLATFTERDTYAPDTDEHPGLSRIVFAFSLDGEKIVASQREHVVEITASTDNEGTPTIVSRSVRAFSTASEPEVRRTLTFPTEAVGRLVEYDVQTSDIYDKFVVCSESRCVRGFTLGFLDAVATDTSLYSEAVRHWATGRILYWEDALQCIDAGEERSGCRRFVSHHSVGDSEFAYGRVGTVRSGDRWYGFHRHGPDDVNNYSVMVEGEGLREVLLPAILSRWGALLITQVGEGPATLHCDQPPQLSRLFPFGRNALAVNLDISTQCHGERDIGAVIIIAL
jgi:hypothetical protein